MKLTQTRAVLVAGVAAISLGASVPATASVDTPAKFRDKDCSDFKSQRQAQRFYKKHNPRRDPHGLDADGDGKACEDSF